MKWFFAKKFLATTDQKREDYYDKLFDDISNEGDRGQTIDDRINTETYLKMMTIYLMKVCTRDKKSVWLRARWHWPKWYFV